MTALFKPALLPAIVLACLSAQPAYADCTNPAAKESTIIYNGNFHTYQFCNGTGWLAYGGGSACSPVGNYSPTAPSGHGYFVMSHGTYNGNLGGIQGADALCLTDLTTNTGWMGYSIANANGQLVASKVHAFLCSGAYNICNNLMPLTTYYFANGGNGAAGGASFTTDSNGLGPNDSANWAAANYFSGSYIYWTNWALNTSTAWASTFLSSGAADCVGFFYNSAYSAPVGVSASSNASRWETGAGVGCSNTENLICFVNP